MESNESFFDEFSPISREEWLARLEQDLRGRPIEDLNWYLGDDMVVPPFYHNEDADENWHPLSSDGLNNDWEISEDILVEGNYLEANQEALNALEFGANSLRFLLKSRISRQELIILLKDINLEFISTHFRIYADDIDVVKEFFTIANNGWNGIQVHPAKVKGSLSFGMDEEIQNAALDRLKDDIRLVNEFMPQFKLLTVDATDHSVKPNDAVETLVTTIQRGIRIFDFYNGGAFSLKEIQPHIQFSLPIGKSYFVEIAKIRALKILWANVLAAYEVENIVAPTIEIHLSKDGLTEDRNTNMIHATTQAMSAVIGGVNRLTVLPSDGNGTAFTKRIARNIQHLLKMESFMDRVHDPAAGSYYIEKLTEQLVEKVWASFQNDEDEDEELFI